MDDAKKRVSGAGVSSMGQEPAILSYLGVLWRRRFLIVFGSLIPALVVGTILHVWPPTYTMTFVYERPLTESQYNVLLRRFYSSENLGKVADRLREKGLGDYAERLSNIDTEQSLEALIHFRVLPAYPKRLLTTDPATSELITKFEAQLIYIELAGSSKEVVTEAAAVIADNFENILPIYDIRKDLLESIREFKTLAAEIEENRFSLALDLQQEKAKLEKLANLDSAPAGASEGDIVIEFTDVSGSRGFLPLSYQKRALQSKIIDVQETLNSDTQKYGYYLGVLKLSEKVLAKLEAGLLTYYTIGQFFEFLGEELLACEEETLADYMKSYIRKTQNLVLVNTRAGERSMVYPLPKRMASRAVLTLIVFAMVTVFVAVMLEYRSDRR